MKYYYFFILLVFLFFSCISSPDEAFSAATKNREKVLRYNLKEYAPEEFNQAEKSYAEAKDAMAKKSNFKANKALEIANKNYLIVLEKGLPKHSEKVEKETLDEKNNAESLKANVAVKDNFNEAVKIYQEGTILKNDKKYEEAIEKFIIAKEKFNSAYKLTKEKKEKSEKSLESTEKELINLREKVNKLNKELEETLSVEK